MWRVVVEASLSEVFGVSLAQIVAYRCALPGIILSKCLVLKPIKFTLVHDPYDTSHKSKEYLGSREKKEKSYQNKKQFFHILEKGLNFFCY